MRFAGGTATWLLRAASASRASRSRAFLLGSLCVASLPSFAAPSTFGPVIGSAILCRSHLDNAYFQSYLTTAFGPSYKHEGGAYWFKADGNLWGAPVTDILISDDSSDIIFVGAVSESDPEKLEQAIRTAVGVGHTAADASKYPVRQSLPGSKIV